MEMDILASSSLIGLEWPVVIATQLRLYSACPKPNDRNHLHQSYTYQINTYDRHQRQHVRLERILVVLLHLLVHRHQHLDGVLVVCNVRRASSAPAAVAVSIVTDRASVWQFNAFQMLVVLCK